MTPVRVWPLSLLDKQECLVGAMTGIYRPSIRLSCLRLAVVFDGLFIHQSIVKPISAKRSFMAAFGMASAVVYRAEGRRRQRPAPIRVKWPVSRQIAGHAFIVIWTLMWALVI